MRIEKTVFISYRRSNVYTALSVYQNLKSHDYDVFFDYESIDAGAFSQIILNQIAARAHFIVILTPSALERCHEPGDWLRREIEYAIDLKRNIIPLMFDHFDFKHTKKHLTGKLSLLAEYNGLEVPVAYFDEAMERVKKRFFTQALGMVLHPVPINNLNEIERKIGILDSLPPPTEKQLTAEGYFERAWNRPDTDYTGQINDYTNAIRLNPLFMEAYDHRGLIRYQHGDYEGAIADYEVALQLNPKGIDAYIGRGSARHNKGDYEGAIADYEVALQLKPRQTNMHDSQKKLNHEKEITKDPKKENTSRPSTTMVVGRLAIAYHAINNTQRALRIWRQLMAMDNRYKDPEWVGKRFNWRPELIEEARKLIAKL